MNTIILLLPVKICILYICTHFLEYKKGNYKGQDICCVKVKAYNALNKVESESESGLVKFINGFNQVNNEFNQVYEGFTLGFINNLNQIQFQIMNYMCHLIKHQGDTCIKYNSLVNPDIDTGTSIILHSSTWLV